MFTYIQQRWLALQWNKMNFFLPNWRDVVAFQPKEEKKHQNVGCNSRTNFSHSKFERISCIKFFSRGQLKEKKMKRVIRIHFFCLSSFPLIFVALFVFAPPVSSFRYSANVKWYTIEMRLFCFCLNIFFSVAHSAVRLFFGEIFDYTLLSSHKYSFILLHASAACTFIGMVYLWLFRFMMKTFFKTETVHTFCRTCADYDFLQ